MLRVARAAAIAALVLASCSPTPSALAVFDPDVVLVVENRTKSTVAFASDPALLFAPCSESAVTQEAIDMAMARINQRTESGQSIEMPPSTVGFSGLAIERPDGSTYPAVVMVSSAGTKVIFEPFDRAALPACEGVASLRGPDDAAPSLAPGETRPLFVANRDDSPWTIRISDAETTWGYWVVPGHAKVRLEPEVVPRSDLRVVTVDEQCQVVTQVPWGDIATDAGGPVGAALIDAGDVLPISLDRLADGPFVVATVVASPACPR